MVTITPSSTVVTGISVEDAEFAGIYHNSVKIAGSGEGRAALYVEYLAEVVNVKNNIFTNTTQKSSGGIKRCR